MNENECLLRFIYFSSIFLDLNVKYLTTLNLNCIMLDMTGNHSSSSSSSTAPSSSSSSSSLSRKKGGRQIEDFMNEMKNNQDDNQPGSSSTGTGPGAGMVSGSGSFTAPKEDKGGSFDTGDPTTTNLYIGNIAPSVTGKHSIHPCICASV